jgi:hypothetical protein
MPFDDTGFPREMDTRTPFEILGLTPISPLRDQAWRNYIRRRDARHGRDARRHLTLMMARWVVSDYGRPLDSFHIRHMFTAPKDVKALVARIQKEYPSATYEVHRFDTDPILYITIEGWKECMAIWRHGVVRAIAGGAKLNLVQHMLRPWITTV